MITRENYLEKKHTERINLVVTPAERLQLDRMAEALGVSKSYLIREGLERVYAEFKAITAENEGAE